MLSFAFRECFCILLLPQKFCFFGLSGTCTVVCASADPHLELFAYIMHNKNIQKFVAENCLIQKRSMHIFICLFIVMFSYFPLAHSQIKPLFRLLVHFFIIFPVDMLTNKGVKRGLQTSNVFHQGNESCV
jgi:hypothetical protein